MNENVPPTHATHEALGYLHGDRICSKCSYNLINQPIIREQHYNMLIVRCPECGSVDGLNDYPTLGRWARRWAAVLAAFLLLLLLAMWTGTGALMLGFGTLANEVAAEPFEDYLESQNALWQPPPVTVPAAPAKPTDTTTDESSTEPDDDNATDNTTGEDADTPTAEDDAVESGEDADKDSDEDADEDTSDDDSNVNAATTVDPATQLAQQLMAANAQQTFFLGRGNSGDFDTWWQTADHNALFADAGGWPSVLHFELLAITLTFAVTFFFIGIVWGIILVNRRTGFLLIWTGALFAMATLFIAINYAMWLDQDYFYGPWRAARHHTNMVIVPLAALAMTVPLFIGMVSGPKVARGIVVFLLPPRLRTPLGWLWSAQGKTMPSRFDASLRTQPERHNITEKSTD